MEKTHISRLDEGEVIIIVFCKSSSRALDADLEEYRNMMLWISRVDLDIDHTYSMTLCVLCNSLGGRERY